MGAKRAAKGAKESSPSAKMKPISQQVAKAHKTVAKKISRAVATPVDSITRDASAKNNPGKTANSSSGKPL